MKLANLLKLEQFSDHLDTYSEVRLIREYKNSDNKGLRIVRKLIARGFLKPFGDYHQKIDKVVQLDGKLYAVNRKFLLPNVTKEITKREQYLNNRAANTEYFLKNFFTLRSIKHVILDDNATPVIQTEDHRESKYNRYTRVTGPTGWLGHIRYSTPDFLVLRVNKDIEEIDGFTVQSVTGWWKSEIKGTKEHYPVTAYLATNQSVRTITRSRNTALQGAKVRLTNQVVKAIAA